MTTDLFLTKSQQMKNWMRDKRIFATHEVIVWGSKNYYNRANRTKQELWQNKVIRTLSDFEKFSYGYTCKDDVYCWTGENEKKESSLAQV